MMWKALKMAVILIPTALMLMNFDVKREETDMSRAPARAMFGDYGDSPDKKALREWVLDFVGCTKVKPAGENHYTKPMACRFYRLGDLTAASAGPLHVLPLGPKPMNGEVGLRCHEGEFGDLLGAKGEKLKDYGLRYSQFCMVNGWGYELSMDIYYGLDT